MPESVEGASIEHAALASLGVGVVAQDAHGTIVLVNDAAERLIGIPPGSDARSDVDGPDVAGNS
jgi:PAS domain-containing protein